MEEIQPPTEEMPASDNIEVGANDEQPEIGQYWETSNSSVSLYAVVMEKDLYMIQFFESITNAYLLNDSLKLKFVLEGFVWKVEPQLVPVG